jgi:Protein of unknown function (DUF3667)
MPTGLEAAADIATGALLGRAVEPVAGERADDTHETSCLNCGKQLSGPYCVACGQKAHVHRTLRGFGHDFLHSVLHFDGKIWRTLPMLFWFPGELTRRYIQGERAKFVSPLALFLFTVFLTFAAFNWLAPTNIDVNPTVSKENTEKEFVANRKDIADEITKLEIEQKQSLTKGEGSAAWIDREIARKRQDQNKLDEAHGKEAHLADVAARKLVLEKGKATTEIAKLKAEIAAAQKAGMPTNAISDKLADVQKAETLLDNMSGGLNGKGPAIDFNFTDLNFPGANRINEAVIHAKENPQLLIYKIQSNAYKYSWALIPLSVPFVWLLFFWRRRFKMYDHAVFVTYSLSFMMLAGTICAIFIQFPTTEVVGGLALAFVPPIHMYRQLHQAYETSRFGAFWRMCALTVFAITALGLFVMLIVALGVTG